MRKQQKFLLGCLALTMAAPAFHAVAQQTAPSVTAPYTDFNGTTADTSVFTNYVRNPGNENASFTSIDANTYEISDQQANYYGGNDALSLVGVSNFNGNSSNGPLNNFTLSSTFSILSGTNYLVGLTSYADGYPFNGQGSSRDVAPSFALNSAGAVVAFDNPFSPGSSHVAANFVSGPASGFTNALMLGAIFNAQVTGAFTGTTLTLNLTVTETGNQFTSTDPNIGQTVRASAVENGLTTDFNYSPQFGTLVADTTYNADGHGNGAGVLVDYGNFNIVAGIVPEPSVKALVGLGALGLCWMVKRKCHA